ncbi:MAG TPA: ABC transporter ATP-binding protein [Candidatus Binatia bacterium]|nr:ABC transporter ATP-binding protein [Candidatus Binatia bacterium]
MSDVLVKVEGVSKKFCRSLKRSLWYGVEDIVADLHPFKRNGSSIKTHSLRTGTQVGFSLNTNGAPNAATPAFGSAETDGRKVEGLRPDEFWAVNNVSFELHRGECIGLIGANGAGKTTLLKMLNGLIKPDEGRIQMHGRVGALIALGAGFNPILTGRENVYVNGTVLGLSKKEIDAKFDEIVDFSGLDEFIDMPVQSYSSGMQVRLGFAVARAVMPDILLIDEVLAVGDASFQTKCINAIKSLQKQGVAIILVSHNMNNILKYCNSAIYLKHGIVVDIGPINLVSMNYLRDQEAMATELNITQPMHHGNVPVLKGFELGHVYAMGSDGARRDFLDAEGPIIFRVPVYYKERPQNEVAVELAIDDAYGTLYRRSSPLLRLPRSTNCRAIEIEIILPVLPITNAKLIVGIAIWTANYGALLGWSHNNQFQFRSNNTSDGRIDIAAYWQVLARDHQDHHMRDQDLSAT